MTDPRHEEDRRIEAAAARFLPVFLEMAVALVHADAPILQQMLAVEKALMDAAVAVLVAFAEQDSGDPAAGDNAIGAEDVVVPALAQSTECVPR
jgi:hypothetical protein